MNPLSRLNLVSRLGFTLTSALVAVGCSSPSGSGSTPSSGDVRIESAVLGTPSTVTAPADGGCSAVSNVVASGTSSGPNLAALCGPGEIPLPVAADSSGCSDGAVTSITFGCVTATLPAPPDPGTCSAIPIDDPSSLLPTTVTSALPSIPGAVCPGFGLVPPPATNTTTSTTAPIAGGSPNIPAPALPTTWPSVPAPSPTRGGTASGSAPDDPAIDAGTLPGDSLPPGTPPVITCCSPSTAPVPQPTPADTGDAAAPPLPTNG